MPPQACSNTSTTPVLSLDFLSPVEKSSFFLIWASLDHAQHDILTNILVSSTSIEVAVNIQQAADVILKRFSRWQEISTDMMQCNLHYKLRDRCRGMHGCCVKNKCLPSHVCDRVRLGTPYKKNKFLDIILPASWNDAFLLQELEPLLNGTQLSQFLFACDGHAFVMRA